MRPSLVLAALGCSALAAAPAPAPKKAPPPAPQAFVEKDGLVVVEAEHFSKRLQGSEMTDHAWTVARAEGASGGEVVEATPNTGGGTGERTTAPGLEYEVRLEKAGTWYVFLRMTGASGQDDSVHAGMDGVAATFGGIGMCHAAYGRFEWVNAVWDRPEPPRVSVPVAQPGLHRFQLWMREDGVRIDKIVLASDPAFRPSGEGPAETLAASTERP